MEVGEVALTQQAPDVSDFLLETQLHILEELASPQPFLLSEERF